MEAERYSAVPLADHGLLQCDDDVAPEWVTYQYCTAHSILRWLPSKLAEWIADNLGTELQISVLYSSPKLLDKCFKLPCCITLQIC